MPTFWRAVRPHLKFLLALGCACVSDVLAHTYRCESTLYNTFILACSCIQKIFKNLMFIGDPETWVLMSTCNQGTEAQKDPCCPKSIDDLWASRQPEDAFTCYACPKAHMGQLMSCQHKSREFWFKLVLAGFAQWIIWVPGNQVESASVWKCSFLPNTNEEFCIFFGPCLPVYLWECKGDSWGCIKNCRVPPSLSQRGHYHSLVKCSFLWSI